MSVLCGCGCGSVGFGWRRLVDGRRGFLFSWCESGCKFGFDVLAFCIFVFIFIFICLWSITFHNFDNGLFGVVLNIRAEFSQFHGKIELCNLIRAIRNKIKRKWQVFSRVEWLEGAVLGFGMVVESWFLEFSAGVIFWDVLVVLWRWEVWWCSYSFVVSSRCVQWGIFFYLCGDWCMGC